MGEVRPAGAPSSLGFLPDASQLLTATASSPTMRMAALRLPSVQPNFLHHISTSRYCARSIRIRSAAPSARLSLSMTISSEKGKKILSVCRVRRQYRARGRRCHIQFLTYKKRSGFPLTLPEPRRQDLVVVLWEKTVRCPPIAAALAGIALAVLSPAEELEAQGHIDTFLAKNAWHERNALYERCLESNRSVPIATVASKRRGLRSITTTRCVGPGPYPAPTAPDLAR